MSVKLLKMVIIPLAFVLMPEAAFAEPRCMSKAVKGNGSPDDRFIIVVSSTDEADFIAKGFVSQACGVEPAKIPQDKVEICSLAAIANEAINRDFSARYSTTPAELCATATKLMNEGGE